MKERIDATERKKMNPKEIKLLLKLKGWRQEDLANAIDVSEGTVSHWVNGHYSPPTGTAMLLKQWLVEASAKSQSQRQSA